MSVSPSALSRHGLWFTALVSSPPGLCHIARTACLGTFCLGLWSAGITGPPLPAQLLTYSPFPLQFTSIHLFLYWWWWWWMSWCVCGDQRSTWRSQFSPSTMWVIGIKLSLLDLTASTITYWGISLAPDLPWRISVDLGYSVSKYIYNKNHEGINKKHAKTY